VGQSGSRSEVLRVVDKVIGECVGKNVAATEAKRDSLCIVGRVVRMAAISRASRVEHTEVARAAVTSARRLQLLAVPLSKGGSEFVSEGLRQHMCRAKRKFASLSGAGEVERPLVFSRGLTMVATATKPSIL
jgi:hypothetical protein